MNICLLYVIPGFQELRVIIERFLVAYPDQGEWLCGEKWDYHRWHNAQCSLHDQSPLLLPRTRHISTLTG